MESYATIGKGTIPDDVYCYKTDTSTLPLYSISKIGAY